MAGKATKYDHSFNVSFAQCSVKKDTASIGVKIRRAPKVTLTVLDRTFTNSALQCRLVCDPNAQSDVDGQGKLVDGDLTLEFMAECKRIGVTHDFVSLTLTIVRSQLTLNDLAKFAFCDGTLEVNRAGEAEEKKRGRPSKDGDDDDADDDDDNEEGGLLS